MVYCWGTWYIAGVHGILLGYMVYCWGTWYIAGVHGILLGYMVYCWGTWYIAGVHGILLGYMVYCWGTWYIAGVHGILLGYMVFIINPVIKTLLEHCIISGPSKIRKSFVFFIKRMGISHGVQPMSYQIKINEKYSYPITISTYSAVNTIQPDAKSEDESLLYMFMKLKTCV